MTNLEKIQKQAEKILTEKLCWKCAMGGHIEAISTLISEAHEAGKKEGMDILHPDGIERE